MTQRSKRKGATRHQEKQKLYIPESYRKKSAPRKAIHFAYKWSKPYIWGVFCLLLAFSLLAGFLLYNAKAPSWGRVITSAPNSSWLLYALNYQTDFFLQIFGVSAFVYALTLVNWGVLMLLRKRISHLKLRLILFLAAIVLISMLAAKLDSLFLSTLHPIFSSGSGGAIGSAMVIKLDSTLLSLPRYTYFALTIAFTLLALSLLILSLGFSNTQIRKSLSLLKTGVINIVFYTILVLRFLCHAFYVLIAKKLRKPPSDWQHNPSDIVNTTDHLNFKEESSLVASFKKKNNTRKAVSIPRKNTTTYVPPSVDLLTKASTTTKDPGLGKKALEGNADRLMEVLSEFGVNGRLLRVLPGPVVTLYELEPAAGVKSSRIISLSDDIARSMSATSARVSVVPGRNAMGIELPNETRQTVYFREILSGTDYKNSQLQLPLGLGKDIGGSPVITDLTKMPHLLVAGTTGSGKSVGVNAMILSLLFKLSPKECKFIMIDPKMLELSVYDGIPHLLSPVVTEPKKAIIALKWVVQEMEARYRSMAQLGVRNINGYNDKLKKANESGNALSRRVQTGFDSESGSPVFEDQEIDMTLLPYIVVVVDEMADLMLVAGKEIEAAVQRLAQMARAAGIHLIMATQRPSVDVITGTIKANFPTRISFQVTSKIDSRTILGEQGAEQLLGRGDMLYMETGGRVQRVHGAFVADDEVERIVNELKNSEEPNYVDIYSISEDSGGYESNLLRGGDVSAGDELYDQALSIVLSEGKVSTSFVQRHLSIGYNRAAKIVEKMEKEGVISTPNRVGKRDILVPHEKR